MTLLDVLAALPAAMRLMGPQGEVMTVEHLREAAEVIPDDADWASEKLFDGRLALVVSDRGERMVMYSEVPVQ